MHAPLGSLSLLRDGVSLVQEVVYPNIVDEPDGGQILVTESFSIPLPGLGHRA